MALIAVAADKGAPGVTTASVALAAVWPRPVLLAECDPAGGDLVYRLPSADGAGLDPRRGLLSLAVAARRGVDSGQVWEHAQRLRGGLDVLVGVANAEQGSGLELMWGQLGAALAALPQADVIADCGRIGAEGRHYDLLARADAVVLVTRASLGDMVRLRDRAAALEAAVRRRGGSAGRIGVVVIADYRHFTAALAEVGQVLSSSNCPARVLGGLAYEPKSAQLLGGAWGGKLDRSLLMRTARQIATELAAHLPVGQPPAARLSAAPPPADQLPAAQPPAAQPPAAQPPAALPPAALPSGPRPPVSEPSAAPPRINQVPPVRQLPPLDQPPSRQPAERAPYPADTFTAPTYPADTYPPSTYPIDVPPEPAPARAAAPESLAPLPMPEAPAYQLSGWADQEPAAANGSVDSRRSQAGGRGRHAGPPGAAGDPGGR